MNLQANKKNPDGIIAENSCEKIICEQDCPYCQHKVELIWVHGHYQCPNCKHVVVSCCGDS